MIVYRNTDVDLPFLWSTDLQPEARWHAPGAGPAQYTSTTPDAAWAEFLRHRHIADPADLAGIERSMWAIDIPDVEATGSPVLPLDVLTGDKSTYPRCQSEAERLRSSGATRLVSMSAAVLPGISSGWTSDPDLQAAPAIDELTVVLFGGRPYVGWVACHIGRPDETLLARVRSL